VITGESEVLLFIKYMAEKKSRDQQERLDLEARREAKEKQEQIERESKEKEERLERESKE